MVHSESRFPEALPVEDALEDTALARIEGERVREALAGLPREQREAIELGFFGGASQEQIARQTGLPLGTVKTRIRSGLRKLRNVLTGPVTA